MALITRTVDHTSGIPLGGLGTGSVEIQPDGCLRQWQIFNLGAWAPNQPEACRVAGPQLDARTLCFLVRAQQEGAAPVARRLNVCAAHQDLYSLAWLRAVEAITFDGRYPVARLTYHDPDLPVALSGLFFSPFTPHDARTSGTPGWHALFTVTNHGTAPVQVALLAMLENPLASGAADRRLHNTVRQHGGATYLSLTTAAEDGCRATHGSLCLAVSGGEASWIAGDYRTWLRGAGTFGSDYGCAFECCLNEWRATGALTTLRRDISPSALVRLSDDEIAALAPVERDALLAKLREVPSLRALWQRVAAVEGEALETAEGRCRFLREVRRRLDQLDGEERDRGTWGDAALNAGLTLAPGETREIDFALGWHFPHHYSALGPRLGHRYEEWFADAEQVARYLVTRRAEHRRTTVAFADTLYDTSLDPAFADAWSAQLSTLAKCTWWTRAGDFAVWEGLGCCGFHTTDITYQGSFGLLALFPELQQRQMAMGARHQRADGRVHHFFTPDLSQVDDGFDRVDMNQQFVLLACRDWLWTGDREQLAALWPHVQRAMANTALLDRDGDGLPDHDTRRNTYDQWNFFGTPSYIASLWLAALRAAVRIAEDLGEPAAASEWQATLARGVASFERKLWNGDYYSLWVDGAERDECCMSDQLSGEWFTHLVGLGHSLPRERIVAALEAVARHNFRPDDGLLNATYPAGAPRRLSTWRNFQAMAPWTGIEYAIGSMLLDFGLPALGTAVVQSIDARYRRAGRVWNHVECGDHYYRAMASWAILLAATGFKVDVPRGVVTFAPCVSQSRFHAPWVAASGWGACAFADGGFRMSCTAGRLHCRELRLGLSTAPRGVSLAGQRVPADCGLADGLAVVTFAEPLTVSAGEVLEVI